MGLLNGKICVVTGGAGSLGRASASAMLREGAMVVLVDKNSEALAESARAMGAVSDRLSCVEADVSQAEDTRRYVEKTVSTFGGLDVLFLNAGISGVTAPIVKYPEDDFDAVMAVNVRGAFLGCKYGLSRMNEGGSIIVTSSIMGVQSSPNVCAYTTSKHALIGLVRCAAKEAAPRKIRVNIVAPGPIENAFQAEAEARMSAAIGADATDIIAKRIPLGRHAEPEEIAETVLFLASDRSSFSTGSVYMADGGLNA